MQLVEKMCVNPAKLYHFDKGYLAEGKDADIVIFNENEEWTVTDDEIASKIPQHAGLSEQNFSDV